jgi:hypothetical protein
MQLASQLRLLTRLSSPSGNSPTLRILRITQRMTWPTHASAVMSVLQGRAGQGRGAGRPDKGQGRVCLSVCLAGQGARQGGQGKGQIKSKR